MELVFLREEGIPSPPHPSYTNPTTPLFGLRSDRVREGRNLVTRVLPGPLPRDRVEVGEDSHFTESVPAGDSVAVPGLI